MPDPIVVHLTCADGRVLPGRLHVASQPVAAASLAPALGVPRRYYDAFGAALAEAGITTLTFDYRGIADAEGSDDEDRGITMADWGRFDLATALGWLEVHHRHLPRFHIGHSCGTQLMGFAPSSERLAGLVLVAPSAPNARQWTGLARYAILFLWRVLIPLMALGRVRFPARRLRFSSVDAPAGVLREWARWGLSPRYLFSPEHGLDSARYARLRMPALVLEFSDDGFAPPATVSALLAEMPGLDVTRRRIEPREAGVSRLGHLGFFHRSHKDTLWRPVAEWIRATAQRARGPHVQVA